VKEKKKEAMGKEREERNQTSKGFTFHYARPGIITAKWYSEIGSEL
jgi:hypothetical protein